MADGQPHTGWSNLGDTWSEPYGGVVMPYRAEDTTASARLAAAEKQIATLQGKIDAVKAAIG